MRPLHYLETPEKGSPLTRRHIPDEGKPIPLLSYLVDGWDSEVVETLRKKQMFHAANRNPIN